AGAGRLPGRAAGQRKPGAGRVVAAAGVPAWPAYLCKHVNVHGHYSFTLPDLGGARRPLRDPGAPGEE
ncbi:MAG: hypothetical protein ACRDOL_28815, partial [Streptosporangiaceae bacterium]